MAFGEFVVMWQSSDQDGDGWRIFGQRYDEEAAPVGEEFRINSHTDSDQTGHKVVALPGGDIVVVWESEEQDGDGTGLYGEQFERNGNAVGEEFLINTHTDNNQHDAEIAVLEDGRLVVTWTSEEQDGAEHGVYGQIFAMPEPESEGDILVGIEGVEGSAFDDTITGNDGDNLLIGGAGNDTLSGGAGDDTYEFGNGDGQDTILNSDPDPDSTDVLAFVDGNDEILERSEIDQLVSAMAAFSPSDGTGSGGVEPGAVRSEVQGATDSTWQPAA